MGLPKFFALNGDSRMPAIGLGTFDAEGNNAGVKVSVLTALKQGYRHIDTAFNYNNEVYVGQAIRESGIPREEITVTTKLLRVHNLTPYALLTSTSSNDWHRPEDVEEALKRSLHQLGLDYGTVDC
jgi:diketogulonate reductase-like aldo/keto reductase